jgi:PAS domain S-box-containing protein
MSCPRVGALKGEVKMFKSNPPPLWWSRRSPILRYAGAVLSVAIAVVAGRLIVVFLHTEPFVSLFLCAVMFAAWFGGFGPGLCAIALSVLAFHYYLLYPINSFTIKSNVFAVRVTELPRIVLFLITAIFVSLLSAAQRNATESLRRSRDNLLAAMGDQKRVESSLRQSEMYLAEAQRLSRTGSFSWDVFSGANVWSEETYRIFGYDKASSPTIDLVLQRIHPNDLALVQRALDRVSGGSKDFDLEHRLLMPDGSVKHVHAVGRAVKEVSGRIELIGAVTDITERKRAEDAMRQAQAELAHVTRVTTLGELTASIAHEVNQPLAAIVTNGEACLRFLNRGEPDLNEVRGAVVCMIDDSRRAGEVIQHVRALGRKSDLQMADLDINGLIEEVILLVHREVRDHGVSLRRELSPVPTPVLGDRVQLQQVIINLVMNGMEAMAAVADRPRDLLIRSRQEADQVLVAVKDSGVGIAPENVDRLFSSFFTTKSNGMGMGLTISRTIIEAHGGRLWATANVPQGAVFQFSLPTRSNEV